MQRNITLRQFRYFLAVAESSSVAAASRMVNVAQSALTKSVQELEDAVGVRLFDRSPKGMSLTADGHRFMGSARRVISAVADASRISVVGEQALTGELSVGVSSLVAGYYLSELFARFSRNHPAVQVQVVEESPQFLEHLLINGELDVAMMVANTLNEPQALMVETLTRSPHRVWVASNHPLAEQPEVSLAECAQYGQVLLEADRIEAVMRSVWGRHGLRPRAVLKTSSLEAVRSLVGVGAGFAVLPDFLYRPWTLDADHVEALRLRDVVPTVDVGLVRRRGSMVNAAATEFIELAREQSRGRKTASGR
jgi:DNA-binding transcriptional LysR family regulator